MDGYDKKQLTVATLGSHSALDILDGAKDEGFSTLVVCQRGREKTYLRFKRLSDQVMIFERFSDILRTEVQAKLRELNTLFVPHRAFTSYVSYEAIENEFAVPLFGSRLLLRTEERTVAKNQYYLLDKAGLRRPSVFSSSSEIDRPVMVKVQDARRSRERAFFTASNRAEYEKKASERKKSGLVTDKSLEGAVIEELVIGTYFNFNYFYSPLEDAVELLGIDRRLQSNLHDYVSLPASQQLEIDMIPQNVEVGHTPATIRESLLEKVFDMGDKFAAAAKREYPPGIIGPFALQSIVTADLEITVYDVSPRVPGSPILTTTSPYSKYHFGHTVGTGRRIAMEIKKAASKDLLKAIVT